MSTAAELFTYNRENFKFNKEIQQKSLHMQQNMRVRQVLLFREDLRDLFDLTVSKMDSYMMVNVLLMGITVEMYFKGRAPSEVPGWLFWCWGISLSGSFFFMFFSTWLALHASVFAQTYMARCLSQWLRLPVAPREEIDLASARLEEFERSSFLDFVRPPVVLPMNERGNPTGAFAGKDLASHWNEFNEHFIMFNKLHVKWQSHEAYARVSMCFGTNMLLSAMSYFALTYYSVDYENPWIGSTFVVLATLAQIIHLRMSLTLSQSEHYVQILLVTVSPLCVTVAAALSSQLDPVTGAVVVPTSAIVVACVGFVFNFFWILFFLVQTYHDEDGLPMKFSTVWCLKILGLGEETIRDIEEPRVDFPGFIEPTSNPMERRPLNTYNVNSDSNVAESLLPPPDLVDACRKLEGNLSRLFAYWLGLSRTLSSEELAQVETLKVSFDENSRILSKLIKTNSQPHDSVVSDPKWVRLTYEADDGKSAPYLVNPETGEIRWEKESNEKPENGVNVEEGLLLITEQLEKYRNIVRKFDYASRRNKASKRNNHEKPPKWPWEFFRIGAVLILIGWASAFVETILDRVGLEGVFSNKTAAS